MKKAIINSRLFSANQMIGAVIVIENGYISSVGNEIPTGVELIDLCGKNIAPGFI